MPASDDGLKKVVLLLCMYFFDGPAGVYNTTYEGREGGRGVFP